MSEGGDAVFERWSRRRLAQVERALEIWVRADAPAGLGEAMRYAVLGGGKRLRPLLVLAASEAVGGNAHAAMRAACAVELVHAYSLVHDDLPCMDNDVLRRGLPTVHVRFGQAQALLAGDALQALAFELLTPANNHVPPAMQARLCRLLARAAGASGMAGGQAIDLQSVGRRLDEAALRDMHQRKTGVLLQTSVALGATCAPNPLLETPAQALRGYGAAVGLAYQVVDDILDVTGDSELLGKTAGKDMANGKPTYVSLLGLHGARAYADALLAQAQAALAEAAPMDVSLLEALARRLVQRAR